MLSGCSCSQQALHHQRCCSQVTPARAIITRQGLINGSVSQASRRDQIFNLLVPCAWQPVIDQASGKQYYWNTTTNQTAWDLPPGETLEAAAATPVFHSSSIVEASQVQQQQQVSSSSTTSSAISEPSSSSSSSAAAAAAAAATDQTQPSMSYEELFYALQEAYAADGTGMQFWEVARFHREQGVFDPPFFDYLHQRQQQQDLSPEDKDLAFKMMCRLSNPLLRQPAPFEF